MSSQGKPSISFGVEAPPLWNCSLGELIKYLAEHYGNKEALVMPWQKYRATFEDLEDHSKLLAKSLLDAGLQHGECVGIIAGNCYQYVEAFLAASRIGCPYVVLNNTYTPHELANAVSVSRCKLLFIAKNIGEKDMTPHLEHLSKNSGPGSSLESLQRVVLLSEKAPDLKTELDITTWNSFTLAGNSVFMNDTMLRRLERKVKNSDVLNLQFTSGTTGAPKAAMLTHSNLINNGMLIAARMQLTQYDIVCCPPPLFHCFGLVIGFLAAYTTGASIIYPSDAFDPTPVVESILNEKCTVCLGVPTMFLGELDVLKAKGKKITTLKSAIAAGSPVPMTLIKRMEAEMGIKNVLNAYGMTETSPVTFMTKNDDSMDKRLYTVGSIMPHSGAKVIDEKGNILPRGTAGELCTCGYALQKGYWNNEKKTKEAMQHDKDGILWMMTGDQAIMDEDGYCSITGRIKDLIIRGGENVFPVEVEERLLANESVSEASVVAIKNERYGEVVGCFLRQQPDTKRPTLQDLKAFVKEKLGAHKAPEHVFWIGDKGVGDDFPKTGSGKHQKHLLRDIGNGLVEAAGGKAKL